MMTWDEIRGDTRFRNRWVALDQCIYDDASAEPAEAEVIDVDEDLSELCTRLSASNRSRCAIVFCEDRRQSPVATLQAPDRRRDLSVS